MEEIQTTMVVTRKVNKLKRSFKKEKKIRKQDHKRLDNKIISVELTSVSILIFVSLVFFHNPFGVFNVNTTRVSSEAVNPIEIKKCSVFFYFSRSQIKSRTRNYSLFRLFGKVWIVDPIKDFFLNICIISCLSLMETTDNEGD